MPESCIEKVVSCFYQCSSHLLITDSDRLGPQGKYTIELNSHLTAQLTVEPETVQVYDITVKFNFHLLCVKVVLSNFHSILLLTIKNGQEFLDFIITFSP